MLISIRASQSEMDEMEMTPNELAAAVMQQLQDGVPFDGCLTELCGFDVVVTVE